MILPYLTIDFKESGCGKAYLSPEILDLTSVVDPDLYWIRIQELSGSTHVDIL